MLELNICIVLVSHWHKDDFDIRKSLVLPHVDRLERELWAEIEMVEIGKNARVGSGLIPEVFISFFATKVSVNDREVFSLALGISVYSSVELARLLTKERRHVSFLGGLESKLEVLEHESGPEAALVVSPSRSTLYHARRGVVDFRWPALASSSVDHIGQLSRVEAPFDSHVHRLTGCDVVQGEQVVVGQLAFEPAGRGAQVCHALSHQHENLTDARDDIFFGTDHECEFAGGSAYNTSRHGSVDEAALATTVCLIGHFCGRHGVNRAAVDEEAFLLDGRLCEEIVALQDLLVHSPHMLRFR